MVAVCGNGKLEAGESCDAGPLNGLFLGNGTGCSKTCTKEPKCRDAAGVNRACDVTCGNGNVEMGEDCDDGNQVDGDGCSADLQGREWIPPAAPRLRPDTEDCLPLATGKCLRLPAIFRDFKNEKLTGGPPRFLLSRRAGDAAGGHQRGAGQAEPHVLHQAVLRAELQRSGAQE